MSEIVFELSAQGGDAVAASFEDIRVKEHLASEETKRLAAELAKIKQSGQVGAQGIEALTRELVQAQAAQTRLASSARQMSAATEGVTRSVRGLQGGSAEMVNMMTEMSLGFGGLSPELREFSTALAGGGNNAVQLSAALGPVAGIITGLGASILPLVITKIVEWSRGTDEAANANNRLARGARNAATETRSLIQVLNEQRQVERLREAETSDSVIAGEATAEELGEVIAQRRAIRETIEAQITVERAAYREAERARGLRQGTVEQSNRHAEAIRQLVAHTERLTEEEERLTAAQTRRLEQVELPQSAGDMAADGEADDLAHAGRSTARRAQHHRTELEERLAREEAFFQELQGLRERDLDAEIRTREQVNAAIRREDELMRRETAREERQALTARRRAMREAERELAQARREAADSIRETREQALEVLTPAVQSISAAIVDVIAGTKSADDAFKGLLASFLEMISQKAALEAAGEFASAIASFASQDYAGGALHLGAGVAWTAVAVAAGAASVAVAPPSAPPASPEQSAPVERGGGGTVVNINGAMVTAGTRAELGRELSNTIAVADRRFGRAA